MPAGASQQLSTFPHHPLLQGRHLSLAGAAPDSPPSPRPLFPPAVPTPNLAPATGGSTALPINSSATRSLLSSPPLLRLHLHPLYTHPTPPGPGLVHHLPLFPSPLQSPFLASDQKPPCECRPSPPKPQAVAPQLSPDTLPSPPLRGCQGSTRACCRPHLPVPLTSLTHLLPA